QRTSGGWATIAGACGAAAVLFKQVALPNVALYGLLVLSAPSRRWQLFAVYVLAAVALTASAVLYFAAAGALHDFLDCVVLHNIHYISQVAWYDFSAIQTFSVGMFQWSAILCLALAAWFGPEPALGPNALPWGARRLALAWLTASFVGVAIGGY